MSRLLTSITSFAACVVGGQAVQKLATQVIEKDSDLRWNPFEKLLNGEQDNAPNQVVTPDKQVSYLEEGFFDAFVNVYDGDMDQSNATRFMDGCKGLKVDLTKMGHIENAPKLMARIEHNRLQVYKAQHLKSLFENGSMPKGPGGIFLINETGPFQPPWGWHPMELAEWYMSKVASLDAMSDRAILTKEGLDVTYHYARQFELAIGLVSKRHVMSKPDAETSLAKKTMDALITHLTHLEVRLHNGGAIPGAYFKHANQTAAEEESAPFGVLDESEIVNTINEQNPIDWDLSQETIVDSVLETDLAATDTVNEESAVVVADDEESAANPSHDDESAVVNTLNEQNPIDWNLAQETAVDSVLEEERAAADNVYEESVAASADDEERAAIPSPSGESAAVGILEKENVPDTSASVDGTADIRRELMEALGAHYS